MSGSPRGSLHFYEGSRLLLPLTEVVGLPLDQINFLAVEFASVLLGPVMTLVLSPRHTSPTVRHSFELICGLLLTYFCFGPQLMHMLIQSTLCLLVIRFLPERYKPHIVVFVVGLGYLSYLHISRLILDYGGYTLDITGPLMIATQRVTSVGYSIYDGKRSLDKLSAEQRKYMIRSPPSLLQYYSYMFYYHGVMVGPACFYNDYLAFIDGSCFKANDGKDWPKRLPSPWRAVGVKFVMLLVNAFVMLKLIPLVPPENLKDDDWMSRQSWVYIQLYMLVSISLVRARFYFAWILGDLANNANGLGFNGYDTSGQGKWDAITNVAIWQLETCSSLKVNIDSWNIGTTRWLRQCVYERTPPAVRTLAVFVFCAIWHGFYPGYYICFGTAALFTFAARTIRRAFRHYFLGSASTKFCYDVVTFSFTRFCNVYMCAPQVVLFFSSNYILFRYQYFYLHVLAVAVLVVVPLVKPFLPRPAVTRPAAEVTGDKKEN